MKKAISFLTLFALLIVSMDATTTPFQQPADGLAKEITGNNASPYPAPKNGPYTFAKETVPLTDHDSSFNLIDARYKAAVDRLKLQAASAEGYAKANHFNTEYCFLVDMSVPSGKNRFFIYNMKKGSLEYSSLVAHGWGSYIPGNDQLEFSNIPNSCQTSLGKYKIGHSYNGTFGLAYKLHGLDKTNSKAYERAIVLHSLTDFPESETYPDQVPESAGCPMVSPSFLAILGKYIRSSKKPVLMWIYN